MRYVLSAAALIAMAAAPAHAGNAFNAAFDTARLTGQTSQPSMSALIPERLRVSQSYVVFEFDEGMKAPSGLDQTSVDRQASSYCRSVKYQLGRALQVSPVAGDEGGFTYFRINRLICFNDAAPARA